MSNGAEAVQQSISDSKGHYDIDGVSLWHGHTIVGGGVLDSKQTGDQIRDAVRDDKEAPAQSEKEGQTPSPL